MRALTPISIVLLLAFLAQFEARAQTEPRASAIGSISGSVTISGKPALGVKVVALQGGRHQQETVAIARTDADGHFQLRNIPAGNCTVSVDAPTFAADLDAHDSFAASKTIKLEEAETVEGINLEIAPGAVITGRVTASSGRPVIKEPVHIVPFKEGRDDYARYNLNEALMAYTDDRGVYRAYGLPAGRYTIMAGRGSTGYQKPSFGKVPFPQSYHPGVTERSKAKVVEIAAGTEASDIDIKIELLPAPKTRTFAVVGRILDAQVRRPLPSVGFHYQSETPDDRGNSISEFGKSDSKGDFRINEIPPGKYTIALLPDAESPWFAEEVGFEIVDSDIRGLEVTARRAGSISGVVQCREVSVLYSRVYNACVYGSHCSY